MLGRPGLGPATQSRGAEREGQREAGIGCFRAGRAGTPPAPCGLHVAAQTEAPGMHPPQILSQLSVHTGRQTVHVLRKVLGLQAFMKAKFRQN